MGLVIPSSKHRRYLSGADWIINTLDCMLKTVTCAGNMSQIVFMLDGEIDESLLRRSLNSFIVKFPVVEGSVSRDLNLAPFWRIPGKAVSGVKLDVHRVKEVSSLDDILSFLENGVNRLFKDENEHLAFYLIQGGGRACFAMTFDHRLLDARGAESFSVNTSRMAMNPVSKKVSV
jgi:hypothetical protein